MLFTALLIVSHMMLAFNQNYDIQKSKEKKKYCSETKQAMEPDSEMTQMLDLSDKDFNNNYVYFVKESTRGVPGWLSQLSIRTLDFGSGHDLMVCESEPSIRL